MKRFLTHHCPVLCAVFCVLGIIVQILLESGKRKRKNLKKAAEIRSERSTANEVEKARAMMDDLDEMPEDDMTIIEFDTEDTPDEEKDEK